MIDNDPVSFIVKVYNEQEFKSALRVFVHRGYCWGDGHEVKVDADEFMYRPQYLVVRGNVVTYLDEMSFYRKFPNYNPLSVGELWENMFKRQNAATAATESTAYKQNQQDQLNHQTQQEEKTMFIWTATQDIVKNDEVVGEKLLTEAPRLSNRSESALLRADVYREFSKVPAEHLNVYYVVPIKCAK